MVMQAEIVAIGPFQRPIVPYLEYPEAYYTNTREGVIIAVKVFCIETGTTESVELAACFHIDPWDFNQHELNPENADAQSLRDLAGEEDFKRFLGLLRQVSDFSSCLTGKHWTSTSVGQVRPL
jgi:hypothetical protein